jgi:CheY-like chemotaxis protein
LTRQLQLYGFRAGVASDGLECLKILERTAGSQDAFDLILLDIEMPVLSGMAAATEIRRREEAGELPGHTPIIAVTGNARREYVDKGMISGGVFANFSFCHRN